MKVSFVIAAMIGFCALGSAQHRADMQHLENEDSFSMIVLGDPQGYIKYDINQPLFDLCTAWIADNIDNLNIKAVLCTGDLVEQNENIAICSTRPAGRCGRRFRVASNVSIIKYPISYRVEITITATRNRKTA